MEPKPFDSKLKINQNISQHYNFLISLAKTKSSKKRRQLLRTALVEELLAIAEICLNILKGNFKLFDRQKRRIIPYVDFLRSMSRVRSERGARKLLIQKGSGVGGLFAALLTPVLIELGRSLINSKN